MKLSQTEQTLPGKNPVLCFLLSNSKGMEVRILSLGAAIQSITLPDKSGFPIPVTLGFSSLAAYAGNDLCAGAALGPNAGRLSLASLPIGSVCHRLTQNDGAHNLHGGLHSLSFADWSYASHTEDAAFCSLTLQAVLPDGLDGFPGNRTIQVTYTLDEQNRLTIFYKGTSDKPTYLNLSNHSYFNLSGDFSEGAGLTQELKAYGNQVVYNNLEHIPEACMPLTDSPFDFSGYRTLNEAMAQYPEHPQLLQAKGYNNAFLAPRSSESKIQPLISLRDPASGRTLLVSSDAPCVVLYSGGYIDGSHGLYGGGHSAPSCALALEAQDLPDAPHFCPGQVALTTPERPFTRTIRYTFTF